MAACVMVLSLGDFILGFLYRTLTIHLVSCRSRPELRGSGSSVPLKKKKEKKTVVQTLVSPRRDPEQLDEIYPLPY